MKIAELRKCPICKLPYEPTGYNQKYCLKCKPVRTKKRDKKCDMCGKPFTDNTPNNIRKYCCDRCRKLAHNIQAADWISKKRAYEMWGWK